MKIFSESPLANFFDSVSYMPVSKKINALNLRPGKQYLIDVQWNLTNSLRMPASYAMIGTFVKNTYIRGRTGSFDSGLRVQLSRSRYESTFNVNGVEHTVSSVNHFYEILIPQPKDFAVLRKIYALPLPLDIKHIISSYAAHVKPIYYRPRHTKSKQIPMNKTI